MSEYSVKDGMLMDGWRPLRVASAAEQALYDRIEKLKAENKQLLAELKGWRKDAMAVVVKPQGMTAYNLLQADEDAISEKLIKLGWTPPDPKENDGE